MEAIIRHVRDLGMNDRSMIERIVGQPLHENERLVIQVVANDAGTQQAVPNLSESLPEWCNVFEGLSDERVAELESVILKRANLSRPSG